MNIGNQNLNADENSGELYQGLKKILVLDDEESVRESVEMILKKDYRVFPAATGKDSMDILEKEDIDLIVTDIRLERENGLDVIETVLGLYNNMKFIVISSTVDMNTIERAKRLGAKGILDKPFRVMEFMSLIGKALGD